MRNLRTYLDAAFWSDTTPSVMCHLEGEAEVVPLQRWLLTQPQLKNHVLFQTSGTTGQAKWVALSKTSLLHSARVVNAHLAIAMGARWGLALPIHHVGGFGVLARSFVAEGECHIFDSKWDAVGFGEFVKAKGCEHLSLVPTQVADLVSQRCLCPESVKTVVVGGGVLSEALFTSAKELGWPVWRSYGMTEAASQIATGDTEEGFLRLLEGWSVRVNGEGLLEWKGESGFSGYVVENEGEFVFEDPKKDQWFTTQDRVTLGDSTIKVLGRADRLVKILGELVDLSQLEQKIESKTGVSCVLFTRPDERRGVELIAVLESTSDLDLDGLHGLETIAQTVCKTPFPRTSLGKIRREVLRQMLC